MSINDTQLRNLNGISFQQHELVELANYFIFCLQNMWSPSYGDTTHTSAHAQYCPHFEVPTVTFCDDVLALRGSRGRSIYTEHPPRLTGGTLGNLRLQLTLSVPQLRQVPARYILQRKATKYMTGLRALISRPWRSRGKGRLSYKPICILMSPCNGFATG